MNIELRLRILVKVSEDGKETETLQYLNNRLEWVDVVKVYEFK